MTATANVTTGKPKVGGAIFRAPMTATLPTDASTELSSDFEELGYVSDDGVTNANAPSVDTLKAWGGDVVMTTQTEKSDTFAFKLIEAMNENVLKTIYGDDNVTGDFETGLTIAANSEELQGSAWVIDTILKGGAIKRIVMPNAFITGMSDITYKDDEAVGYDITVTCLPDEKSNTHYEYILGAEA